MISDHPKKLLENIINIETSKTVVLSITGFNECLTGVHLLGMHTLLYMHEPPNGDVPLIEVYLYSTARDSFFGNSPYYWFSKIFGHKIFLPQMGGF